MLKRRPSKRFVLAETGEESAWNTTIDNDLVQVPPPPVPPVEIGMVKSPSSGQIEDAKEEAPEPPPAVKSKPQLLRVPQLTTPGLK